MPVSGVCYAARMQHTKPPRFEGAGLWLSIGLVISALLVIALLAATPLNPAGFLLRRKCHPVRKIGQRRRLVAKVSFELAKTLFRHPIGAEVPSPRRVSRHPYNLS
jgi:hypothetical protein